MQHRHDTFHFHDAHRRVFPGAEFKRDGHVEDAQLIGRDDAADDIATVYSVVYVTASKSFDGDVAGYTTPTVDAASTAPPNQTSREAATSASTPTMNADQSAYAAAKSSASNNRAPPASSSKTANTSATTDATPSSSVEDASVHVDSATSFATSAASPTSSSSSPSSSLSVIDGPIVGAVSGSPPQATRESSSQSTQPPQSIQQTSNGMTGGQQAGLAIGILAAFALAAGLLFFCWRKRKTMHKKDGHEQLVDEKHGSFFGSNQATPNDMTPQRDSTGSDKVPASVRSTRTASVAPRLSLRPVTQFLPILVGGGDNKNNNTSGATVSEKTGSAWERRPAKATENPFADAAVLSEKDARPASTGSETKNPFAEPSEKSAERSTTPTSTHSKGSSSQSSEPTTPKSVKLGTASAIAVGKSGPSAAPQANNVHRVQLDFKPSMEDELELRSGQLVRMLHEYDDGWALCVRMDRSQQGVCPRTCLSNLPVKPRNGPPPPGQRPPPGMRRPSNPNGPMYPRPLTPTSQAAANKRQRSASNAQKPTATAVPARKPVPGQAL